ncbi:hypothetical protein ES703_37262 [subsurface metagenome]
MKRDTKYGICIYMQPAFLICAAVLAIAGSGMSIAIKSFGIYLKKEPLPLKKPLDRLDEPRLGGIGIAPYKVVLKHKIENEEIIKSLGTEDYIQWILEDLDEPFDSAVRKCLLFITYYDLPDRVPHVPEECYMGVGYQRLASDSVTFKMNKDGSEQNIPGRHLVFASTSSNYWASDIKFSAFYLFSVNGVYTDSRENARIVLNRNIFGKHSYFSKVEWNFLTGSGAKTYLSKEEAIAAGEKLLGVILPILEREHWPDWEK